MIREECDEMEGRVSVPPQLHPLNRAKTADVPIRVCPPMDIRPDHVNVEPVDQVSPSDISLELYGAFDRGELILHLNVIVVKYPVHSRIPDPVRFSEGKIELQLPRVAKAPVLRMEGVWKDVGWNIGRHCV